MNKYLKKILLLFCAATFSLILVAGSNAAPLYAAPLPAYESDPGISPQSDDIVWYYKKENGKTYKRKYNRTTKKWIGGWILVP